jgi:hypothetical protein
LAAFLTVLRQDFWNWATPRLVLTLPALAAGAAGALVLRNRRVIQLLAFVLLSYLGVAAQTKFFAYHYGYVIAFLALLAGWGWDQALTALSRPRAAWPAFVTAGLVALLLLLSSPEVWDNGVAGWRAYAGYLRHPASRAGEQLATPGYVAELSVARYIRDRTQPDDSIYVWGFDPMIYMLAGHPPAARFLFPYPLMSSWAPRSWQGELAGDLQTRRPAYIVVLREYPDYWIVGEYNAGDVDYIARYPALQQILSNDYQQETEIADRILYRRVTP